MCPGVAARTVAAIEGRISTELRLPRPKHEGPLRAVPAAASAAASSPTRGPGESGSVGPGVRPFSADDVSMAWSSSARAPGLSSRSSSWSTSSKNARMLRMDDREMGFGVGWGCPAAQTVEKPCGPLA